MIKINNKNIKNIRGFTLIELMITVAIIGILAAVAISNYQNYIARSQVSEGLVLASGSKPVIAEYYSNHGRYPSATDIGFSGNVGSYISQTTIGSDGKIIATLGNKANSSISGETITLTPEEDENTHNLKWSCTSTVDSKYLPNSCLHSDTNDNGEGGEDDNGTTPTDPESGIDPSQNWSSWWVSDKNFSYNNGVLTTSLGNATYIGTDNDGNQLYSQTLNGYTFAYKVTPEHDLLTCYSSSDCTTGQMGFYMPNANPSQENMQAYGSNYVDENGEQKNILAYLPQTVNSMVKNGNYENSGALINAWNGISRAYNDLTASATAANVAAYNQAATQYVSMMKTLKDGGTTLSPIDEKFIELMSK